MEDIRGEPIQLIYIETDSEGKETYEINYEALSVLQAVDTPVAIVSICGGLKCGKSFLLNTVLGRAGPDKEGFQVHSMATGRAK